MANQKKVNKKLQELEEQYVEKTLSKEFKSETVQNMYADAQERTKAEYSKVLLKASLNEEEAKALATLKRKRFKLKLAKAGATILQGLGIGAVVLLPVALGAGAGILAGIALAKGIGALEMLVGGLLGASAVSGAEYAIYCKSERANKWLNKIGQARLDNANVRLYSNNIEIGEINKTIDDQAETALDEIVSETKARIQQDKKIVARQKKENPPSKDDQYSVREEAINKFRAAVALARQTEIAGPVVGEQPEA